MVRSELPLSQARQHVYAVDLDDLVVLCVVAHAVAVLDSQPVLGNIARVLRAVQLERSEDQVDEHLGWQERRARLVRLGREQLDRPRVQRRDQRLWHELSQLTGPLGRLVLVLARWL